MYRCEQLNPHEFNVIIVETIKSRVCKWFLKKDRIKSILLFLFIYFVNEKIYREEVSKHEFLFNEMVYRRH